MEQIRVRRRRTFKHVLEALLVLSCLEALVYLGRDLSTWMEEHVVLRYCRLVGSLVFVVLWGGNFACLFLLVVGFGEVVF